MCSVEKDIEDFDSSSCSAERHTPVSLLNSTCKKCDEKAIILVQKKDPLCRACFLLYCHHKFRATIGKTKRIKTGNKILIAYSGGLSSSAMLHMVKEALECASYKKLIFSPKILYIDESSLFPNSENMSSEIPVSEAAFCPVLFSSLEMVFRDNDDSFYWDNCDKMSKNEYLRSKLSQSVQSIKSLSSKQDYVEHLRLHLITDIAEHDGCNAVFTGESATDLATTVLSNISLGRGSQVSANTKFYDERYKVPICRPMREFLNDEIAMYCHINNLSYSVTPTLLTMTDVHASIQRLTEDFINGLQENFPATIFTVFRIGEKLSTSASNKDVCFLCNSKRDDSNPNCCSALVALKLSAKLSELNLSTEDQFSLEQRNCEENSILSNLCHGCQITVGEMGNDHNVLLPLLERRTVKYKRKNMKNEIHGFLLDPDNEEE